jgi:site-specific DNA recombinase
LTTPQRKKAFLYLRVSSQKQIRPDTSEGLSIPEQRIACQHRVAALDAEVAMEYVERASAKTAKHRPALQQMLTDLRSRQDIDYVVVWKLERFARKRFDEAIVGQELEDLGVELISVSENIDNTASGRFLRGVLASHAEYDNAIRAERARMSMTRKAQLGGTPYQPPPGYRIVHTTVDGRQLSSVEVDPEQGALMTAAFRRYSSGDISLAFLAEEMFELGLRTRYGSRVKPNQMHKLLRSEYYLGKVPFRGEVHDGNHPPLIDQATFDRVQAVMRAHSTAGEKRRTHNHYLKGSVFCGHCCGRLIFNLASGNGGKYSYFFCVGRRTGCPSKHMRVEDVERAVENHYRCVQLGPQTIEAVRTAVHRYSAALRDSHETQALRLARRLAAIQKKRDKLFEAYAADALSLEQFKRKQRQLDAEQADAEDLQTIAARTYENLDHLTGLALDIAQSAATAYRTADPLERRIMNQVIFERLLVTDDGIKDATFAQPFADLLDESFRDELEQATHELRSRKTTNRRRLSSTGGWNETILARPRGFEPLTFGSVDRRSIQLSYGRVRS